jgi:hypothetical protein
MAATRWLSAEEQADFLDAARASGLPDSGHLLLGVAMSPGIAGLPWFSEDDYAQMRRIMADDSSLPEDYGLWLRGAETAERDLREQGHHPIRIAIVPDDFAEWCRRRGLRPDAAARREFARYVLAESQ